MICDLRGLKVSDIANFRRIRGVISDDLGVISDPMGYEEGPEVVEVTWKAT